MINPNLVQIQPARPAAPAEREEEAAGVHVS